MSTGGRKNAKSIIHSGKAGRTAKNPFPQKVNYRRLKAGGIPLHRCPIEQTYKGSSAHVFVLIASIYFGEVNLRYLHCFMTQCKGSIQPLPEGQRYNLPLDPNAMNFYPHTRKEYRRELQIILSFPLQNR